MVGVVEDHRVFVENLAEAVAAIILYDAVTLWRCYGINRVADIVEVGTGGDAVDAGHHGVVGGGDKLLSLIGNFADRVHARGVAVVAVEDGGDVDIEDVAFGKYFIFIGNSVADDIVDADAAGFGVALVAQGGRNGLVLEDEFVNQIIKLQCAGAGLDVGGDVVERLGRQLAGGAHFTEFEIGFRDEFHRVVIK